MHIWITIMQKLLVTLLGISTVTLAACSGNSIEDKLAGKAVSKLEGTSWQLVVADPKKTADCENLPPVMDFLDAKRVSGNLGCNLFNTEYQLDGKKLTFKDAAVTRRMCAPEAMQTEAKLLKVLQDTRFVTQNEQGLMFWNEKGELLVQYEPEKPGACE